MLFNSYSFILVFLPVSLCGFYLLARLGRRPAALWLVAMSLVFYACWNVVFVLLLIASIGFNYLLSSAIGRGDGRPSRQTALLALGIAANLAALVYYKYLAALLHFAHGLGLVGIDDAGHRAAARHLVLHLHPDRLSGRCAARAWRATAAGSTTFCS